MRVTEVQPDKYPGHYFNPIKISITQDSVLEGYGFITGLMYERLIYVEEKPVEKEIKSFRKLLAREVKQVEFLNEGKTVIFYSVKVPHSGQSFMVMLYGNSKVALFNPGQNKIGNIYILHFAGDKENYTFKARMNHPEEALPKGNAKFFERCPELKEKIEKGVYKNTVHDMEAMLDFFEQQCK